MPPIGKPLFILGTAQLGAAYGRTNAVGHLTDAAAVALLECAVAAGVRDFDTARAYGISEERIGLFVRAHGVQDLVIRTKLDPMGELQADSREQVVVGAVDRSLETSLKCLGMNQLPVLMLHRAQHIDAFQGAIMRRLLQHRKAGVVGSLGVSVNTPQELMLALGNSDVAHVQMPFNILESRWSSALAMLPSSIAFDVRSIFLQGLLANPLAAKWPAIDGYSPPALIAQLIALVHELDRADVRDLAVAYVRGQAWVDGCVVGIETETQLKETMELFRAAPLAADECEVVRSRIATLPDDLVQPWRWPLDR